MTADPRCAELEEFLLDLAPRDELTRRWAIMSAYPICLHSSLWRQRIRHLLDGLRLGEDDLAQARREADQLAAELLIDRRNTSAPLTNLTTTSPT